MRFPRRADWTKICIARYWPNNLEIITYTSTEKCIIYVRKQVKVLNIRSAYSFIKLAYLFNEMAKETCILHNIHLRQDISCGLRPNSWDRFNFFLTISVLHFDSFYKYITCGRPNSRNRSVNNLFLLFPTNELKSPSRVWPSTYIPIRVLVYSIYFIDDNNLIQMREYYRVWNHKILTRIRYEWFFRYRRSFRHM